MVLAGSRQQRIGLVVVMLTLMSWRVEAGTAEDMVLIQSAKISIYGWMSAFFIYQADPGDSEVQADFRRQQTVASTALQTALERLAVVGLSGPAGEVHQHYEDALAMQRENLNDIARRGGVDNESFRRMLLDMQQSVDGLERARVALVTHGDYRVVPEVMEARNMAVLMQYLDARYQERSYSVINVSYSDMAGGRQHAIDELARDFAMRLARLQRSPRHVHVTQAALHDVTVKWRFIERSLINWQEKVVPFTVHHNTASIVNLLNQIADTLERA